MFLSRYRCITRYMITSRILKFPDELVLGAVLGNKWSIWPLACLPSSLIRLSITFPLWYLSISFILLATG